MSERFIALRRAQVRAPSRQPLYLLKSEIAGIAAAGIAPNRTGSTVTLRSGSTWRVTEPPGSIMKMLGHPVPGEASPEPDGEEASA